MTPEEKEIARLRTLLDLSKTGSHLLRTARDRAAARVEVAEAVLRQHVELTVEVHDAWAAEGTECRPCKCPGCRTYRAALWVLDLPDSGQQSSLGEDEDEDEDEDESRIAELEAALAIAVRQRDSRIREAVEAGAQLAATEREMAKVLKELDDFKEKVADVLGAKAGSDISEQKMLKIISGLVIDAATGGKGAEGETE